MYVETQIRGLKVEASFSETTDYAQSFERQGRSGQRIINIELFAEDMPQNEAQAIDYLHKRY